MVLCGRQRIGNVKLQNRGNLHLFSRIKKINIVFNAIIILPRFQTKWNTVKPLLPHLIPQMISSLQLLQVKLKWIQFIQLDLRHRQRICNMKFQNNWNNHCSYQIKRLEMKMISNIGIILASMPTHMYCSNWRKSPQSRDQSQRSPRKKNKRRILKKLEMWRNLHLFLLKDANRFSHMNLLQ